MNRSRRFSIPILSLLPALLFAAPALAQTCPSQTGYTVNADGTVTDEVTGLIWDRCSWGQTLDNNSCTGTASTHNWQAALGVAVTANAMDEGAGYLGYNDWRLPNRTELESLVDVACSSPAINTDVFPDTPSSFYWSSTTYAPDPPGVAWDVDFDFGSPGAGVKTLDGRVRLVRGGQSFDALAADEPPPPPVEPGEPAPIPTLQVWGLLLLGILLGLIGMRHRRRAGG